MANVFLSGDFRDIETAILMEKATVHDIGNAVAFIDQHGKMFINTEDNLLKILPAYDNNMLKWLLWHEKYHDLLKHHKRYFKYLEDLRAMEKLDEFTLDKNDVNIIMDILVHDTLSSLFPELVETAVNNLAQMRNRNSLGYTFTTFTLEEMLDEYKHHKEESEETKKGSGKSSDEKSEEGEDGTPSTGESTSEPKEEKEEGDGKGKSKRKGHGAGGGGDTGDEKLEDGEPEVLEDKPEPEHHKTDWSKLKEIDSKEFITQRDSDYYTEEVEQLKLKKLRLAKLTETLNGLATTTRTRTYAMPSTIKVGSGIILKGRKPGKTSMYLCFDASGSMGRELNTFKEIISKTIPQALDCPCEWFSGYSSDYKTSSLQNPDGRDYDYYKGKFKDILPVHAGSGYDDDGDRVIELCWLAEQQGYTPIGVTDGGGRLSWSKNKAKELRRTILVGQNEWWLDKVKEINPRIQTLNI